MKSLITFLAGAIIGISLVVALKPSQAMPIGMYYGTNGSACSSLSGVEKHACYGAAASFEILDKLDDIKRDTSSLSNIELHVSRIKY
jgi:hypothetical protein